MKTGFFMGKLTAIGSMRLIFMGVSSSLLCSSNSTRAPKKSPGWMKAIRSPATLCCGLPSPSTRTPLWTKPLAVFVHLVDAQREMMDAALRIAFEEFGDRRIRPRRLHQLDLRGAELDIGEAHALLGVHHARPELKAVFLVEVARRRFDIRHDDRDMA